MNKYESIFIISTLLEDEKIQEIIGTVKNLIESSGQLEKVDEWGKKRLAYEVNDQKEGYYVLMHFLRSLSSPPNWNVFIKLPEAF